MVVSSCCVSGEEDLDPQVREVWQQLHNVCDPELDEPITDMGFVETVVPDSDGKVAVSFRLPTYWCSANFAYLMASDIRLEVEKLDWVSRVNVRLEDHMFEEQVNTGVNEGMSFRDTFADLAPDEGLDEIREKFRKKAFQRRQEVMLIGLRQLGIKDEEIVRLTLSQLDAVQFDEDEEVKQKPRYLEIIGRLDLANGPDDLAFRDYDGNVLKAEHLTEYLSVLRGVRINMEFSGALCRGLLSTRYKELDRDSDEPTLVDFILDRVPPRELAEST